MRPAFEEELEKVQSERGHGCIITGEDIKVIIPKVHAVQHCDSGNNSPTFRKLLPKFENFVQ